MQEFKSITFRFTVEEFAKLKQSHLNYMVRTGKTISLTAYIKIKSIEE